MYKILILLCISLITPAYSVEEVEVKDKYPFFRQFRSGFNITFGSMSILKSTEILADDESTQKEKNYAYILTAIGAMRLTDGLYYMFTPSLPEIYLADGKLDSKHKNFKQNLHEAAQFEEKLRKYRATVIFLNGLGFFGIYTEDPEENKLAVLPGLGMMLVSAYAYFAKAPAEKAYQRVNAGPELSFNFYRSGEDKKLSMYPQLSFRF